MKQLLLILALACSGPLSAQIINNRNGSAFRDGLHLNQEFLWQNKVRTITGTVSIKRPNRPIDQRPDMFVQRFNEVGLLAQVDQVKSVLHLVDSLRIEYKRNDLGEVELRSEQNRAGYSTTRFVYDKDGQVVRVDYGSSENVSADQKTLEPGRTIIVNSESFSYASGGPLTVVCSKSNNYGLLYSRETVTTSELGYIVSETEELIMSGRTTTRSYTYNEHGWVSAILTTDNQGGPEKKELFYYDAIGNLLKVEYFEGNTLLLEKEVLYTDTFLIEATLEHDLQSHDIVITKFAYEFYP